MFPVLQDIRSWCPEHEGEVTIATDLMVINVSKQKIKVRAADVSGYAWIPEAADPRQPDGVNNPNKDLPD